MIDYEKLVQGDVLKTPAYIFNMDVLKQHLERIKTIAGFEIGLCYAMKANPFLLKHIVEDVSFVEVCSPGELSICKFYRIPGEKIIFSGVNKTKDNIREALEYGAAVITAESLKHFALICECCDELRRNVDVYLRLSNNYQFGMNANVLEKIIKTRGEHPNVNITGIHYFAGTQRNSTKDNISELNYLNDYLDLLLEKHDFCVKVLEYGTGLSVPYFTNQDFEHMYAGLIELTDAVRQKNKPWKTVFEMGRFFVSGAADYATQIVDIKYTGEKNYCIVDGGIHQLNYYGQNMALRTPVFTKISSPDDNEKKYYDNVTDAKWIVCGSLCTFADILMKNVLLSDVDIGDVFIFKNAGAYSIAEAPVMLLNRDLPNIYEYREDKGFQLIKESESVLGWYCNV